MLSRTLSRSSGLRAAPLRRSSSLGWAPSTGSVNGTWCPDRKPAPELAPKDNATGEVSARHWEEWTDDEIDQASKDHVMFTWGPSDPARAAATHLKDAEGIYVYDRDGKQYIDWTSQAICVNLGYTIPEGVRAAIDHQLDTVPFAYGGFGMVDVRCRISALMAEVCPGDINGFLFPSSGAEANEAAVRIARRYTGKHKILTRYRSYHGGTATTMALTGDFRRWWAEAGVSGFVKLFDPNPFQFAWGDDEDEATAQCLSAMEEQIRMEGPDTIAAVHIETIPGSGGVLIPPRGYIQGVRALCDKYKILLIADEVMLGFGRTGKMFGFQHFEGVLPDIVTFAKGISGSWLPLAGVGMRAEIQDHFRTTPPGWGSTYQAHPTSLACGYEVLKHMVKNKVVENAASLEPVMKEELQTIIDKHPSVRQARVVGLFGCMDFMGPDGNMLQDLQGPPHPAVTKFKAALLEEGVYGLIRPPMLHCAPPLIINEEELRDGFARVSRAISVMDEEAGH